MKSSGAQLVAVVALAATMAGCAAGVQQPPAASTLAAQREARASIARSAPTPSPVATPSATPSVPATQTPVSASPSTVLKRFAARFGKARPDYHIACTAKGDVTSAVRAVHLEIGMEADVSGNDFSGTMSVTAAGFTRKVEVVLVDGEFYARLAGSKWRDGSEFEQTEPVDPFTEDYTSDFEYRGTVVRDGRTLHDLYLEKWIGGDVGRQLRRKGIRQANISTSDFDVFVGDDGLPVSATLKFTITGRYEGQPVTVSYDVLYAFSNIGKPVTITAPI